MKLKKMFLGLAATCLFAIPSVFAQNYLMANQFKLGGLALYHGEKSGRSLPDSPGFLLSASSGTDSPQRSASGS